MMSGFVVKYNMWFSENPDKKSLINALDQKKVIHTLVDSLNNILDFNSNETSNYIFEYYSRKFFGKLQNTYSGDVATCALKILKDSVEKKITIIGSNKIIFKT